MAACPPAGVRIATDMCPADSTQLYAMFEAVKEAIEDGLV